jgi:CubicO group peptidase (beta-lactamase class C family)
MRGLVIGTIAAILAILPQPTAALGALDKESLKTLLKEARSAWEVPGFAVAVVDGDSVLLDAVGVRALGAQEPLTPDSICGIGSVTKSMLATTLAALIQQGKADWDDPVQKHLPWFRLSDPLADRDVTLRDLLCHRTGIARHDMLWYRAPWTVEETIRRMAFLELDAPFRASYRYNNLAFMAAGLALEQTTGAPWQDTMRQLVHKPLGMDRTMFLRKDVLATPDHAIPHLFTDGTWKPAEWYDDDHQTRASGSVKSCARDLARWLQFHLRGGIVDGKQLIERKYLDETYRPHTVMPVPPARAQNAGTIQTSYALGWMVSDYRGQHLLEHGGAVDGFRTTVMMLPRRKFGVAVLTNCTETTSTQALALTLLDRYLGRETSDWHKILPRVRVQEEEARKAREQARAKERIPDTKPSRPLDSYTGVYRDKAYGQAEIELKDGKLWLKWSSFRELMTHYHYDTFALPDRSQLGPALVVFQIKPTGEVGSVRVMGRDFTR